MTPPSAAASALNPGATVAGRYRVIRLIGSGGMGDVYECTDREAADRRVAVKMYTDIPDLPSDVKQQLINRFVREGRTTARIASPHVVHVFDAGVDVGGSDRPYIAMGLLQGQDLESLIEKEGPLRPVVAVRIVLQAAWGLHAAHREGIIHRDIKPSNLFLHEDEDGLITVKVVDFGIAKPAYSDEMLTRTGSILGSPLFMAPEQVTQAKDADERADVWGLGATLYTALAGVAPWQHISDVMALLRELCTKPTPHIQDRAPWITPQLAALVHGALIREPDRRCPSIAALIKALEPRSGGTMQLRRNLLRGLPESQRGERAQRAILPITWRDVADSGEREHAGPERIDNDDPLVGQSLGGKYQLVRRLGRGGMGAVYEAHAGGERFAVKVILDEAAKNPAAVRRFVREAKATMAIDSPYVVKVHEVEVDLERQVPYIVMEMLRGADLARVVREHGALAPDALAEIFVQVCQALAIAHARGIVHRDIKPANIFLHTDDHGNVTAKLCDFGVAKAPEEVDKTGDRGPALTQTGGFLGSPMYMSPEQAQNAKSSDAQSDLWSLGASLYEALSGHRLWEESLSVGAVIFAICTAPIVSLRDRAPWIDPDLERVVARALERDRAARWNSAETMGAALANFMRGQDATRTMTPLRMEDLLRKRLTVGGAHTAGRTNAGTHAGAKIAGATPGAAAGELAPSAGDDAGRPGRAMTANHSSVITLDTVPENGPRWLPWVLGGVGVAAIVGLGALVMNMAAGSETGATDGRAKDSAGSASPKDGAAQHAAPAKVSATATIAITPQSAVVTVDGKAQRPDKGALRLTGAPGDSFQVVASTGSDRVECTVVFLKDGRASVLAIDASTGTCRAAR